MNTSTGHTSWRHMWREEGEGQTMTNRKAGQPVQRTLARVKVVAAELNDELGDTKVQRDVRDLDQRHQIHDKNNTNKTRRQIKRKVFTNLRIS